MAIVDCVVLVAVENCLIYSFDSIKKVKRMTRQPNISEVITEAEQFRILLELGKKASILLVTEDFPVMNCKLSSLLFAYHALQKWPSIVIFGVSGRAKNHDGDDTISHYWLELLEVAIDLTADQYNMIEDDELNSEILKCRPFKSVTTGSIKGMQNYDLFSVADRDTYVIGMPTVADDFFYDLQTSYEALVGLGKKC